MTSDVRCLACHRMVYLPAHCGKCGAALPELVAKPEPVKSAPLFATPADAVACLRTYLGGKGLPEYEAAWSALESLEAEVGRLTAELSEQREAFGLLGMANSSLCEDISELNKRRKDLESELAEKTAALVEYATAEGGHDPGCDCVLHMVARQ